MRILVEKLAKFDAWWMLVRSFERNLLGRIAFQFITKTSGELAWNGLSSSWPHRYNSPIKFKSTLLINHCGLGCLSLGNLISHFHWRAAGESKTGWKCWKPKMFLVILLAFRGNSLTKNPFWNFSIKNPTPLSWLLKQPLKTWINNGSNAVDVHARPSKTVYDALQRPSFTVSLVQMSTRKNARRIWALVGIGGGATFRRLVTRRRFRSRRNPSTSQQFWWSSTGQANGFSAFFQSPEFNWRTETLSAHNIFLWRVLYELWLCLRQGKQRPSRWAENENRNSICQSEMKRKKRKKLWNFLLMKF